MPELPKRKSIESSHNETDNKSVKCHVSRLYTKLLFKTQFSGNKQIKN